MKETVIKGFEIENGMLSELGIKEWNSVRFWNGDEEILVNDLKMVVYNDYENSDYAECIYCEPHKATLKEDLHFMCEICGNGMCDDCYEGMVEHINHYHLPLENCDDEREIELIAKACGGNDNPDYICEDCMNRILSKEK